ncbi:hypothetical protein GOP47_0029399 [Adiantum capillus-veneris]|nr:hypothetical protein GOP47_0029399 [Adiantum capillus-veneris]
MKYARNPLFAAAAAAGNDPLASDTFFSANDVSTTSEASQPSEPARKVAPPSPPSSSPAHGTEAVNATNDDNNVDGHNDPHEEDDHDEKDDQDAVTTTPVSLFRMLSAASDKWDWLLMIAGSLGAFCFGLVQPAFFIFFGKMINAAGDNADKPKYLQAELSKLAFTIFTISTSALVTMWVDSTCWMYTAERQVCKMRYNLLKAVLYQDVEFFDTKSKAAQIAGVMSTDIGVIHSAIGFKFLLGSTVRLPSS